MSWFVMLFIRHGEHNYKEGNRQMSVYFFLVLCKQLNMFQVERPLCSSSPLPQQQQQSGEPSFKDLVPCAPL